MKGQDKLVNQIKSLIENNKMPHSILLIGPEGCGKKTLCREITEEMHLELFEIDDKIDAEFIAKTREKQAFVLYSINSSSQDIKAQNLLLKLLEEPCKNVFIILRATSTLNLLNTIQNRCIQFNFSGYAKDILRNFITTNNSASQLLLEISNTPGDIMKMQNMPLSDMYELADKMFNKMHGANYANSLSILNRIAFKNEQNLFDPGVFLRVLCYYLRESCIANRSYSFTKLLTILNDFIQNSLKPNINRRYLWEASITKLWGCLNDREY